MSIALDRSCSMVSLAIPDAVLLSVVIGVAGCGCPSSAGGTRIGQASFPLWNNVPSSASAASEHWFEVHCGCW